MNMALFWTDLAIPGVFETYKCGQVQSFNGIFASGPRYEFRARLFLITGEIRGIKMQLPVIRDSGIIHVIDVTDHNSSHSSSPLSYWSIALLFCLHFFGRLDSLLFFD